jgi:predicted lipoprotein
MDHAIVLFFIVLLLSGCTVVPIEELNAAQQSAIFDPVSYVDGIWQSQILPDALANAVDASTVLATMDADLTKSGDTYGRFVGGSYNFTIKGQGQITAVDTSSRYGIATVQLDGYQGPTTVLLQIGPSLRGDALRDAGGLVTFGQFKDQTEFGQVSRELNKRVAAEIVNGLDPATLVGKTVSFTGVYAISTTNQTNIDLSTVTITPVAIEIK